MNKPSRAGYVKEHVVNDVGFLRYGFPAAGAYVLEAWIEADSVTPYELRLAPVVTTRETRPSGAAATITIAGTKDSKVAVIPAAMLRGLDSAALTSFEIKAATYRVLLVRDSNYVICRRPCADRKTVALRAGQAVTVSP